MVLEFLSKSKAMKFPRNTMMKFITVLSLVSAQYLIIAEGVTTASTITVATTDAAVTATDGTAPTDGTTASVTFTDGNTGTAGVTTQSSAASTSSSVTVTETTADATTDSASVTASTASNTLTTATGTVTTAASSATDSTVSMTTAVSGTPTTTVRPENPDDQTGTIPGSGTAILPPFVSGDSFYNPVVPPASVVTSIYSLFGIQGLISFLNNYGNTYNVISTNGNTNTVNGYGAGTLSGSYYVHNVGSANTGPSQTVYFG